MKTLSLMLNLYAVVNLIFIILAGENSPIPFGYVYFGVAYCIFHLSYQFFMREGIFNGSFK